MARPDPLDALRLNVVPVQPRAEFASVLRGRIEAALGPEKGGQPMDVSEVGYITISVPDAERARAFFGGLLRWEFAPGSAPQGYQITNMRPMGGLWGGQDRPEVTLLFHVGDVEAAVDRVRSLGGEAEDPEDRPYGRIASCRDDQGLRFDLLELPADRSSGGGASGR
jgi:predicted enzyme related to lactoylglutathione lyase